MMAANDAAIISIKSTIKLDFGFLRVGDSWVVDWGLLFISVIHLKSKIIVQFSIIKISIYVIITHFIVINKFFLKIIKKSKKIQKQLDTGAKMCYYSMTNSIELTKV